MKKMNKKGFTLIELLVVIAIIGLLSTMAVISLNSARAKSRDAKRLSDVKQMATALALEAADNSGTAMAGCLLDAGTNNVLVTTCTGPGNIGTEFDKFTDPSSATAANPCLAGATATCGYSATAAVVPATVSTAQIRFYLENASGSVGAGVHTINAEGIIN